MLAVIRVEPRIEFVSCRTKSVRFLSLNDGKTDFISIFLDSIRLNQGAQNQDDQVDHE